MTKLKCYFALSHLNPGQAKISLHSFYTRLLHQEFTFVCPIFLSLYYLLNILIYGTIYFQLVYMIICLLSMIFSGKKNRKPETLAQVRDTIVLLHYVRNIMYEI